MPVDLDAPIRVIPCGKPGDLDALSGRAHLCDRTRIAVTECIPFEPVDCSYCLPDTAPARYGMELPGVVFCEGCNATGERRSYRLSWVEGSLYSSPPLQFVHGAPICYWLAKWGLIRHELFTGSPDCTTGASTVTEGVCSATLSINWAAWITYITLRIWGPFMDIFRGTVTYPSAPDCRTLLIPNQLVPYCYGPDGLGRFGHSGSAILKAM